MITVVYKELDDELIEALRKDDNVVVVEQRFDVSDWIEQNDVDGWATKYAYDIYCEAVQDPLPYSRFTRFIKKQGYKTKNIRIDNCVRWCFVR